MIARERGSLLLDKPFHVRRFSICSLNQVDSAVQVKKGNFNLYSGMK